MNKPEIIIPEPPKINITINNKKSNICSSIQEEKKELEELKKIRAETGFSLGKLIELKKKGYKIVKVK